MAESLGLLGGENTRPWRFIPDFNSLHTISNSINEQIDDCVLIQPLTRIAWISFRDFFIMLVNWFFFLHCTKPGKVCWKIPNPINFIHPPNWSSLLSKQDKLSVRATAHTANPVLVLAQTLRKPGSKYWEWKLNKIE